MSDCPVCERADRTGWFGIDRGSHCRKCHRTWTGLAQAHCTVCHRHFTTDSAAVLHHTAKGCADPATLLTKAGEPRLVKSETQHGPIWGWPQREGHPQARAVVRGPAADIPTGTTEP